MTALQKKKNHLKRQPSGERVCPNGQTLLSNYDQVSHNYERKKQLVWYYGNIFPYATPTKEFKL